MDVHNNKSDWPYSISLFYRCHRNISVCTWAPSIAFNRLPFVCVCGGPFAISLTRSTARLLSSPYYMWHSEKLLEPESVWSKLPNYAITDKTHPNDTHIRETSSKASKVGFAVNPTTTTAINTHVDIDFILTLSRVGKKKRFVRLLFWCWVVHRCHLSTSFFFFFMFFCAVDSSFHWI